VLLSKSFEVRDRLLTLCAAYGISTDCVPLAISVVCTATECLLQGDVEVFLNRLVEMGSWPSSVDMDQVWTRLAAEDWQGQCGAPAGKFLAAAIEEVANHRNWEDANAATLLVAAVKWEMELITEEQRGPIWEEALARLQEWQEREMPWLSPTQLRASLYEDTWLQCPGTVRNWVLESPEEVLVKYVH
jgi:hypothetical protein